MSGEEFSQDVEDGEGDVESAGSDSDESDLGARGGFLVVLCSGSQNVWKRGWWNPWRYETTKTATSLMTSRLRRLNRLMVIFPRHHLSATAGMP